MREIQGLVGTGMMYGAIAEPDLFEMGLDMDPDYVARDAGSVDPGPAFLGSGNPMVHRSGTKQSMEIMLKGSLKKGVPLLIGSVGIAGTRPHLDYFRSIVEEIAQENRLSFRLGLIDSEQDKVYVRDKLGDGKIHPLGPVPPLTEGDIDRGNPHRGDDGG